jgi:hypothetical protein
MRKMVQNFENTYYSNILSILQNCQVFSVSVDKFRRYRESNFEKKSFFLHFGGHTLC